MSRPEIEQTLLEIVQKEKQIDPAKFTRDTPLADAGIDSLDALTILFAIEEHFKISIPDERARAMKTFGDMADTVEALVGARR
ncbi:MAG TPA: acyl carrier protein [Thermoanaerobaculia bacterium]|nr:acyl carrier protein [Thermoanaerobaculia bacterium]